MLFCFIIIIFVIKLIDIMPNKVKCFEYILVRLIEWYSAMKPDDVDFLSFTRLKALKLLFFVAAVKQRDTERDLLDIFNNFYAMQHGPVESDIYNNITNGLMFFNFEGRNIKRNNTEIKLELLHLEKEDIALLDNSINTLREINPNIVIYSASSLVNLSHKWESWQIAIAIADIFDKGSERMEINLIRNDKQYFSM